MRLRDKVALITGGATGIGQATAKLYAREGCRVVIADVNGSEAQKTLEAIAEEGGEARFVQADVSRRDDVRAVVEVVEREYGRLDVLVTCAGIYRTPLVRIDEFDEEVWEEVMGVNLKGTFLCAKYAVPLMQERGGAILFIASTAGVTVASDSLAYGASKGGVRGLAFTLKEQLAPLKIRVHVVCPNELATPLKLRAIAEIAEIRGESPEEALAAALPDLAAPEEVARVLVELGADEGAAADDLIFTK